jgi:ubiquinone/menaquinone biosynthesis C-methylase UbiE
VTGLLTKAAWAWAGVPSGPLGWVSSHWVMPRFHAQIYPVLARELKLRPEDDLLEVACGSGVFLADHAPQVRRVAGLDLSSIQVDRARRRLADRIAAGTAEIVHGDAAALPWPDGTFQCRDLHGLVRGFS